MWNSVIMNPLWKYWYRINLYFSDDNVAKLIFGFLRWSYNKDKYHYDDDVGGNKPFDKYIDNDLVNYDWQKLVLFT